MASWQDQYLAALKKRDSQQRIHLEYAEAYSRLADHTASLTSKPSSDPSSAPKDPSESQDPSLITQLRSDLSAAQASRGTLTAQVEALTTERDKLSQRYAAEAKKAATLLAERNTLAQRMRDKNDELRGKARLAQEAQDEMLTLQLQLHMAEEKAGRLEKENKELVERWMKKMGQEAEAMNDASRFT